MQPNSADVSVAPLERVMWTGQRTFGASGPPSVGSFLSEHVDVLPYLLLTGSREACTAMRRLAAKPCGTKQQGYRHQRDIAASIVRLNASDAEKLEKLALRWRARPSVTRCAPFYRRRGRRPPATFDQPGSCPPRSASWKSPSAMLPFSPVSSRFSVYEPDRGREGGAPTPKDYSRMPGRSDSKQGRWRYGCFRNLTTFGVGQIDSGSHIKRDPLVRDLAHRRP